jgi:hypothetical protein
MIRWLFDGLLKIALLCFVIWFLLAAFENGLERTLAHVGDTIVSVIQSDALAPFITWPALLVVMAVILVAFIVFDTSR